MSFLTKTRSKESYESRISTEPKSTQNCRLYAVRNFEQFVSATYDNRTIDDVVEELLIIKKGQERFEDTLFDMA